MWSTGLDPIEYRGLPVVQRLGACGDARLRDPRGFSAGTAAISHTGPRLVLLVVAVLHDVLRDLLQ
eukprot:271289-Heterocapsa_arctica.AAC.1